MMRKILKYTSVFSLYLAGLVFCAHLVLPHDHHIADTFLNQDENCPASNNKSHHHQGFPMHCHAFNMLASEKAITYVIAKYIQSENISTGCYPDTFTEKVLVFGIIIPDIQKPFPESFLLELSPLRAPPSLS